MAVQRRRDPRNQDAQPQPDASRTGTATTTTTTTTTTTIPTITTTATPSTTIGKKERSFQQMITIDLLLKVLHRTFLHPFIAWIIVLCLRAQVTPFDHPAFILATSWASILTLLAAANVVNQRIAYGTPRPVDLSEEVIVVTGGASGLGLLIAQIYGLRGASVAVLDVKEVSEIAETWEESVSGVEYYRCDVGNRRDVEATRARVVKDLGTPTVLVNCAAAGIYGQPVLSLSADAFHKTIRTNLLSVFHTCQVFLPGMLDAENGGTIVNVSSVLGHLSAAGLSDYATSKAGLSALHRTIESELRATGDDEKVKMVLVETGQMATPLFDWIETPNNFFAPVLEPVQVAQEIVNAIDSGRGGVIRLPAFATLVNWYAVLPAGIQRIARYISGIDQAVTKSARRQVLTRGVTATSELSESEIELIEAE